MSLDVREFAKTEWEHFSQSKTVKAVLAMEVLAVGGFAESLLDGSVQLTRQNLALFALSQAAVVLVFLWRHTQAGIEAKIDGAVAPEVVRGLAQAAERRAVALLARTHPAASQALAAALAAPPAVAAQGNAPGAAESGPLSSGVADSAAKGA